LTTAQHKPTLHTKVSQTKVPHWNLRLKENSLKKPNTIQLPDQTDSNDERVKPTVQWPELMTKNQKRWDVQVRRGTYLQELIFAGEVSNKGN